MRYDYNVHFYLYIDIYFHVNEHVYQHIDINDYAPAT